MNYINKTLIYFISIIALTSCSQNNTSVIDKTIKRINTLEKIETYTSTLFKNSFQNNTINYNAYFDFTPVDTVIGTKYRIRFDNKSISTRIYNGKSLFSIKQDTVTFQKVSSHPLDGFILLNPILRAKYMLREALKDSSISILQKKDTIINNEQFHNIEIKVKGKFLVDGKLMQQDNENLIIHNMYIDKNNFLPKIYITNYTIDSAVVVSTIKSIDYNYDETKLIWELDDFPKSYTKIDREDKIKKDDKRLITIGEKAKSWELSNTNGDTISYSPENNKLTLLGFWLTGCGACIQSQPYLNNFYKQYKDKGLNLLSIEFGKTDITHLKKYIKHEQIKYPVMSSGKSVAEKYGATSAPTFILVDSEGIVVYVQVGSMKEQMDELENEIIKRI